MTNDTRTTNADRRQALRLPGDAYPLRLGRQPARLVDWSAKGIGLQVHGGAGGVVPGQAMTVSIHSELTNGVALFPIVIRRVDADRGIIGADFLEDAEGAPDFLAQLLLASGETAS
ncbi:PilZ domain-containing protein [Azospirillum sp. B4]|uniref:PilZ domain-containing protein n=1 Tax=Azospirillum sp. B4 TaxID=95605 RepID=UPI00034DE1FB|nr:PilZ domain-containing protein [Azospirillum sp. B4]